MKSKNLMLMGVAILCGLVAAFVVARLGATNPTSSMINVVVAAKELPPGTQLKEPLTQLSLIQLAEGQVPPKAVTVPTNNKEELNIYKDKYVAKSLRVGTPLTNEDLTPTSGGMALPDGKVGFSIKVTQESAPAAFFTIGSRVDVMLNEKLKDGRSQAVIIMRNVLVVAVDTNARPTEDNKVNPTPSTVTVAVTPEHGLRLGLAADRGNLRLMLRDKDDSSKPDAKKDEEDAYVVIDKLDDKEGVSAKGPSGKPAVETVLLPVATADIPAGTKIENPGKLFKNVPFLKETVPANAWTDLDTLEGKTIERPLLANQFVPKSAFDPGAKPATKPEPTRPPSKVHVMVLQNGPARIETVTYVNGVATTESTEPRPAPPSTPTPKPDEEKAPAGSE